MTEKRVREAEATLSWWTRQRRGIDEVLLGTLAFVTAVALGVLLTTDHPSLTARPQGIVLLVNWSLVVLLVPVFVATSWLLDERSPRAWARGWIFFAFVMSTRVILTSLVADKALRIEAGWFRWLLTLSAANNVFFAYAGLLAWSESSARQWKTILLAALSVVLICTWALPTASGPAGFFLSLRTPLRWPELLSTFGALLALGLGQLRLLDRRMRRPSDDGGLQVLWMRRAKMWLVLVYSAQAVVQVLIPSLLIVSGWSPGARVEAIVYALTPAVLLGFATGQMLLFIARRLSRFYRYFEGAPIARFVVDRDGLTIESSAQEAKILGYLGHEVELMRQPRASLFERKEDWLSLVTAAEAARGLATMRRMFMRHRGGDVIPVDLTAIAITDGGTAVFYSGASEAVEDERLSKVLVELSLRENASVDLVQRLTDLLAKTMGADVAAGFVTAAGDNGLILRAVSGIARRGAARVRIDRQGLADALDVREVTAHHHGDGKSCVLCVSPLPNEVGSDPGGVKVCVQVPLMVSDHLLALVWLQYRTRVRFDEGRRDRLQRFANVAAVFLQRDDRVDLGRFRKVLEGFDPLGTRAEIDAQLSGVVEALRERVPTRGWALLIAEDDFASHRFRVISKGLEGCSVPRRDEPLDPRKASEPPDVACFVTHDEVASRSMMGRYFDPFDCAVTTALWLRVGNRGATRAVVLLTDRLSDGQVGPFSEADAEIARRHGDLCALMFQSVVLQQRVLSQWHLVAHELSHPVAAIRAEAERGAIRLANGEHQRVGKSIETIARHALMLHGQLDSFEFLDTDGVLLGPRVPSQLREDLLDPVLAGIDPWLSERGFDRSRIAVEVEGGFPPLEVDPLAARQVFFNLLRNAIRYSGSDRARFAVTIRATVGARGPEVRVEDHGIGVPEEWTERIFERGQRTPDAVRTSVRGFGLGLYLVRRVMEALEGKALLENRCDPTVFLLRFPPPKRGNSEKEER